MTLELATREMMSQRNGDSETVKALKWDYHVALRLQREYGDLLAESGVNLTQFAESLADLVALSYGA